MTGAPVLNRAKRAPGTLGKESRDGRWAAQYVDFFDLRPGQRQTLTLVDARGKRRGQAWFDDGVIQEVMFSDDGNRLAVVATHHFETDDQHDTLYVLALD